MPAKILIFDDEPSIRALTKLMLERNGYRVAGADCASTMFEILAEAHEQGEAFCVAILDLSMPDGQGGVEVLPELRKLYPELKTFVSSGYSSSPEMMDPRAHGFDGAITKPFHMQDLLRTISQICLPE